MCNKLMDFAFLWVNGPIGFAIERMLQRRSKNRPSTPGAARRTP